MVDGAYYQWQDVGAKQSEGQHTDTVIDNNHNITMWMSTTKVARLEAVTSQTIRRWIQKGKYETRTTDGGHLRVKYDMPRHTAGLLRALGLEVNRPRHPGPRALQLNQSGP